MPGRGCCGWWPRKERAPLGRGDAAMVALDTMPPVVELRQDDRCEVNEDEPGREMWSVLLALYSALGLVILPMFLATVTGLMRRD